MMGGFCLKPGFRWERERRRRCILVYADGSGVESVRCDHGRARWGGTQLASGDVVFTHGTSLARFTSAMAHEVQVPAPRGEYAGAIAETASGAWLLSARATTESKFAIKMWMPGASEMHTVLARNGEDLVEPVLVALRMRPNRHPSGLHPWDYANLLALDARVSRDGELKGKPVSVRLEAQDAKGHVVAMGTAPVESDGSFFVKVPVDSPIRFELLDFRGTVSTAGAWVVLGTGRRAAHLRGLSCGAGARIGEPRTGCTDADNRTGGFDRRQGRCGSATWKLR